MLCRAAFTPHNRTLEVRPGRISKTLELDYDNDVKVMAVLRLICYVRLWDDIIYVYLTLHQGLHIQFFKC